MTTEQPTVTIDPSKHCIHCPAPLADGLDGSPLCRCTACGYCTHPSQSARDGHWWCNACGHQLSPLDVPAAPAVEVAAAPVPADPVVTEEERAKMLTDVVRAVELDLALPPMHHSIDVNRHCVTTKPDGNGGLVLTAAPTLVECRPVAATAVAAGVAEMRGLLATLAGHCRALIASDQRLKEAIWPGLPKFVPTVERPQMDFYEAMLEGWREEIAKLQAFKDYVHGRLDAAGVPADPDSPHRAEGCRIGGRLDLVLSAYLLCVADDEHLAKQRTDALEERLTREAGGAPQAEAKPAGAA